MREVKFELVAKNMSGTILREQYTLDELMGFEESFCVDIVAKRQFTGLTDKKGVDIYEGDILHYDFGLPGPSGNISVIWDDKQAKWSVTGSIPPWGISRALKDWIEHEVIGNIYENPDLLTKEDK